MSSLLVYDLYGYFTWFHLTKLIHVISMNKQLCGQEHFHNWYACIQLEITLKLPRRLSSDREYSFNRKFTNYRYISDSMIISKDK
jgi:hypothetical protein